MAKRSKVAQEAFELAEPVVSGLGFDLVDCSYVKEARGMVLTLYIDKRGGIGIDDCETVSRALESLLDREDYIREAYVLEVSSPGLGRPIKKEKDYVRNEGKEIELRLYKSFEHEKELRGILKAWSKDSVTIQTGDGRELVFQKKELALVREAFDW